MSIFLLLAACLTTAAAQDFSSRPNLVLNGSFEDGLANWPWQNSWYESPQGSGKGVSQFEVDQAISHEGKCSARVTGQGNRGIILQSVGIRPERYRLSGWIRAKGLGTGSAAIIIEWLAEDSKWLSGMDAGQVTGEADWTFVSADVTPPENARMAHVDCLTRGNNSGTVWFDDIRLIDIAPGDNTPPPAAAFRVRPAPWAKGTVIVDWPVYDAPADFGAFRVYVSEKPFADVSALKPAAEVNGSAKSAKVHDLTVGAPYYVAAVPVDLYGNMVPSVTPQRVVPTDPQAPRLTVTPLIGPTGALAIRLLPPFSGAEPQAYEVTTDCGGKTRTWKCTAAAPLVVAYGLPHDSEVTVKATAQGATSPAAAISKTLPAAPAAPGRAELSGRLTSADGKALGGASVLLQFPGTTRDVRTGPEGGFEIASTGARTPTAARLFVTAPGYLGAYRDVLLGAGKLHVELTLAPDRADTALWTASPIAQIFQDEVPPTAPVRPIRLVAGRNEPECYQIVIRPKERLEQTHVIFEDLRTGDGKHTLASGSFTPRFVNYVHVDRNSRATPKEELVRVGPADYPDELSDDTERTLEPDRTQPIFLTFSAPPGTAPGTYRGNVHLATTSGLLAVPVNLEVLPLDFPDQTRLWVVNWFDTNSFESRYGVAPESDDWWAMLRDYARMFRRYHQNAVTVSPALCRIFVEPDGSHTYDWSGYDRWCETFMAEGVRRFCVEHLGGRKTGAWEEKEFVLYDRPATVRATGAQTSVKVEEFVAQLQKHLEAKGWLDMSYQHIGDEPIPVNVASWKEQSARVHAAAPKLKRLDAIQVPDLRGFCELWVPQLNYFDQWNKDYDQWRRDGLFELWFYIAWVPQGKYPNRLIDTAAIKPRVIHWMNYLYHASGYLHWGLNHWDIPFNTFSPGDEWMTWPGQSGPNSSLRYEAQRDGLEDCEYLYMLEDAQRAATAKLAVSDFDPTLRSMEIARRIVRSLQDYTRDYDELEAAREELMREIVLARQAPLALVRTEPTCSLPIVKPEVSVTGVTEAGCTVTVNGQPARRDGNRFTAQVKLTPEAGDVTVVIRKGTAEKKLVRHFSVGE